MADRPRIGGIIIARLDSTRLPGKVLTPIHGRSLLWYVVERARALPLDALLVATSDRPADDPIDIAATDLGLSVYRGPAADVAARLLLAARAFDVDWILRLNCDSPFIAPDLIAAGIAKARHGTADFVTNLRPRTYPYGVALELIRRDVFETLIRTRSNTDTGEHPTRAVYDQLHRIAWTNIERPGNRAADLETTVRLTLDTPDDLQAFTRFARGRVDRWRQVTIDEVADSGIFQPAAA